MMSNKFNSKPCFPYTYGDLVENDDTRFSHKVVNLIGSEEFQKRFFVLVTVVTMLGSSPANAMPPEAGEYAANAAAAVQQEVPPLGEVQGAAAAAANQNLGAYNPMQGIAHPQRQNPPNFNTPTGRAPVKYNLPGPPQTVVGQRINTTTAFVALGVVCMQGYWGNPVFMWGCVGMVIRFLLKVGNVENL